MSKLCKMIYLGPAQGYSVNSDSVIVSMTGESPSSQFKWMGS